MNDTSELFNPAESEIEFVRNSHTNRVHVSVPLQEGDGLLAEGISYSIFTTWFRVRTLCGQVLSTASMIRTDTFADDLTCMNCHKAMGDHSDRLFEHAT